MKPIIELRHVSKWYGNVIGINDLTLRIHRGVTGLLGPNGAGKSTFLQLVTGQLHPSQGGLRVLGEDPWRSASLKRSIGLCPEQDAFYDWMTGWDFIYTCARLDGMYKAEARHATAHALKLVGMTEHMNRAIAGYSKGMRQRTKVAQALVHDPDVVFLDEPLNGTDPVARRDLIDLIRYLGRCGKSVVVSSHFLHEVQAMTPTVILLNRCRLVAEGDIHEIRELIDKYPHRIVLVCRDYRALAARLVPYHDVEAVRVQDQERSIMVETRAPDAFYGRLPQLTQEDGLGIEEVYSEDDNLEAVFKYLVNR